jgi:hypothetical protein
MTKIMSQVTLTGQDPKTLMSDPDDKLKNLAELINYVRQGGREADNHHHLPTGTTE